MENEHEHEHRLCGLRQHGRGHPGRSCRFFPGLHPVWPYAHGSTHGASGSGGRHPSGFRPRAGPQGPLCGHGRQTLSDRGPAGRDGARVRARYGGDLRGGRHQHRPFAGGRGRTLPRGALHAQYARAGGQGRVRPVLRREGPGAEQGGHPELLQPAGRLPGAAGIPLHGLFGPHRCRACLCVRHDAGTGAGRRHPGPGPQGMP